MTSRGLVFQANPLDLQLITRIKAFTGSAGSTIGEEWSKLSGLKIENSTIVLDYSALQLSEYGEEAELATKD